MSHDPVYYRLRETSWRRELTPAEQAELRAFLESHPESRADWEAEAGLNAGLHRLRNAPVPSNFTARVLQAVELETAAAERERQGAKTRAWWRVFAPHVAVALLVVGAGWFGYQHYRTDWRKGIAEGLAVVAKVESPPSPLVLEDFEAVRRLNPTLVADEELLELNKELLALTQ